MSQNFEAFVDIEQQQKRGIVTLR